MAAEAFSALPLDSFSHPDVEPICINLQDTAGADAGGGRLVHPGLGAIGAPAAMCRTEVGQPFRRVRRAFDPALRAYP